MTFALGEMYKVRREYANGIEASAFAFHVLGSRLYNGFVPRYYHISKNQPKIPILICVSAMQGKPVQKCATPFVAAAIAG